MIIASEAKYVPGLQALTVATGFQYWKHKRNLAG